MSLKDQIHTLFEAVKQYKDYPLAIEQIKSLDASDDELFGVLWPEAIQQQEIGRKVFASAYALYHLNIACPLSPEVAINQVCRDWDISIEEIPWYIANQFSKEVILQVITQLDDTENVRLTSIHYWVSKMA